MRTHKLLLNASLLERELFEPTNSHIADIATTGTRSKNFAYATYTLNYSACERTRVVFMGKHTGHDILLDFGDM
jgi:hypothetical protein